MAKAPFGYKLNYPIETPEAIKFWESRHKCNRAKAICAFSLDEENALRNFTRRGYTHMWAKRAVESFGMYCAQPDMTGIPFSDIDESTGDCMPIGGGSVTPPVETVPTVTILTTPKPVQVGDSVVITAKVTGNPAPTISWKVSVNGIEAPISDTDDSISYTVAEAGTLIFTCTATNKLGFDSDSITYTASEKPKPLGSINFDPTKPEDIVIYKLGPVQLVAEASPVGLDGEPTYKWLYSEDGSTWVDGVGSSTGLSYYLSIAETPAKGETRYFKCTGNGTTGGIAIPQEETRVVSVTYSDATPFSGTFKNRSFSNDTIDTGDEFSYFTTAGEFEGSPFVLAGSVSQLEMESSTGVWEPITELNTWSGFNFPNNNVVKVFDPEPSKFKVRLRIDEGGNTGRTYISKTTTFTLREAVTSTWDDSATWNDNINW